MFKLLKERFFKLVRDITSIKILAIVLATWLVYEGKITGEIWLLATVFSLGGRIYEKKLYKQFKQEIDKNASNFKEL